MDLNIVASSFAQHLKPWLLRTGEKQQGGGEAFWVTRDASPDSGGRSAQMITGCRLGSKQSATTLGGTSVLFPITQLIYHPTCQQPGSGRTRIQTRAVWPQSARSCHYVSSPAIADQSLDASVRSFSSPRVVSTVCAEHSGIGEEILRDSCALHPPAQDTVW